MWWLPLLLACVDPVPVDSEAEPGADLDGDGAPAAQDCDDADAERFPGAVERCDGVDQDCSGAPHALEVDADGDGALDCAPCEAAGYWPLVDDTPDEGLIAALRTATDGVRCSYNRSRDVLFTRLDYQGGGVTCVYTGKFFPIDGYPPDWDAVNTEHSWPQSLGAEEDPAQCDLHHLYPTDAAANARRANLPFGEVSAASWSSGGSTQGKDLSGAEVFEPPDAHKGNVARSMLYFATRYGKDIDAERLAVYRAWDALDPVDPAEEARSFEIFDEQETVNPYVACPTLAARARFP